jgi:hypothetical protein
MDDLIPGLNASVPKETKIVLPVDPDKSVAGMSKNKWDAVVHR